MRSAGGRRDDLPTISAPIDFVGVNYYRRNVVRADPASGHPVEAAPAASTRPLLAGVGPDHLYELLVLLHDEYDVPRLYVTENGAAFEETRLNGRVDDPRRRSYIEGHIDAVGRARRGRSVAGYFVWSLLDNFEWSAGLLAALRARVRRLRHLRADPEVELRVVPRLHRRASGSSHA